MQSSLFSVLMAVYHKDDPVLLRSAINSVYENSLLPYKLILVQDGPVGTELSKVINEYAHRDDFYLIILKENAGLSSALNTGLMHSTTDFIFRADADDISLSNRFENQLPILVDGYDLVGGAILEVDKMGEPIAFRNVPSSTEEILKYIPKRNPFNHMTVAFRRTTVVALGGYPNVYLKEDYALWASMISNGCKVTNLNQVLVYASGGIEMYKRRGGIKYIRSELTMQKFLIQCKLQTYLGAFVIGSLRSLIYAMPPVVRGWIYEIFLRESTLVIK